MRYLILISISLLLSCSKTKPAKVDAKSPGDSKEDGEEKVTKVVKEEFVVEKLSDEEKLQILLGQAPKNESARAFQEVSSFLDPYGETYAYLNFQDTKDKYTEKGKKLWEMISSNMQVEDQNLKQIENFKEFVHSLGVLDIDAVGLSHKRLENGLIKNKFALHKRPSNSPSLYWHSFGKSEKFDCVDLFPESTFFATGYRADLEVLTELSELSQKFSFSEKTVKETELIQDKVKLLKSLNKMITGEVALILYGDISSFSTTTKEYNLGYALYIKTRKEADLKELAKLNIEKFKQLFSGVGSNLDKEISITRKGDYMIVADKKNSPLLSNGKLLIKKESFKTKMEHVEIKGSMFNYLSPEVTNTFYNLITAEIPQEVTQDMLDLVLSKDDFNYHYLNVMENRPEGFYYSGISTGGSYGFLGVNFLATFLHHFIFFDKFSGAKELEQFLSQAKFEDIPGLLTKAVTQVKKIQPAAKTPEKGSLRETRNDLEFLKNALVAYSNGNNEYFPSPDGADGLRKLVEKGLLKKSEYLQSSFEPNLDKITSKNFVESEISYLYLGANTTRDTAGYLYPLVLTKPGIMGTQFMAILANGEIAYFKTGGEKLSSMLFTLNKKYRYNERQKGVLREKFKDLSY